MESLEFMIKNFFPLIHQTITNMGYSLGEGLYENYQSKISKPINKEYLIK